MARIRSVKPSFFSSLDTAALPIPTRLTFIGLWCYADDKGRGIDDTRLIKAAVWPMDRSYTERKVGSDMDLLARRGLVERYEVAGQQYFRIRSWHLHQHPNRPQPSKLPASPEEGTDTEDSVSDSVNGHGARTNDAGPEGRGVGEEWSGGESVTRSSSTHVGGGDQPPDDDDQRSDQTAQAVAGAVDAEGLDGGCTNLSDADTSADLGDPASNRGRGSSANGRTGSTGGDATAGRDVGSEDPGPARRSAPENNPSDPSVPDVLGEVWALIAEAELAARVAEKGPVGLPEEWRARARYWAEHRHAETAAQLAAAQPDWPARRLAAELEPDRFAGDTEAVEQRRRDAARTWGARMAGVLTEDELVDDAARHFAADPEAQAEALDAWRAATENHVTQGAR